MSFEWTTDGDYYVDKDGVYYQDVESLIMGQFNFCGCGNPNDCIDYIKRMLEYQDSKVCPFSSDDNQSMFFLYWADSAGLLEHGTSVRGSWVTSDGMEFIEIVNKLNKGEVL